MSIEEILKLKKARQSQIALEEGLEDKIKEAIALIYELKKSSPGKYPYEVILKNLRGILNSMGKT